LIGTALTAPIITAIEGSRQKLAAVISLDNPLGALKRSLGQVGVEMGKEEKRLAGVSIDRDKQRRIGEAETALVDVNLSPVTEERSRHGATSAAHPPFNDDIPDWMHGKK
jgi:hypothetical protein